MKTALITKALICEYFCFIVWKAQCILALFFFFTTFVMENVVLVNGQTVGFWVGNTTMFTALVLNATFKIMIETKTWERTSKIFFGLSVLSWFIFALAWNGFPLSWGFGNADVYYVSQKTFGIMQFWLAIICTPILCMFPEIIFKYLMRMYIAPTRLHVIEELEHVYPSKRDKFVNSIEMHLQKQQQKNTQKHEEEVHALHAQGFLGFAEFHLDPSHPDYVMSEEQYMAAVRSVSGKKKT